MTTIKLVQPTIKTLNAMSLHDKIRVVENELVVTAEFEIIRVHTGWVYNFFTHSTFVPYV